MTGIFNKVEDAIITKLSFPRELCNYILYSETHGRIRGYLYKTDESTYNKIKNILEGKNEYQIKKKDKVYLLPGNSLPAKRIKEHLKSIGAYLTTDISKATVIAGNSNYYCDYVGHQALMSELQFATDDYYIINQNSSDQDAFNTVFNNLIYSSRIQDEIQEDWYNGIPCILSDRLVCNIGNDYDIDRIETRYYFLQPILLEIVYNLLSKKLPIISEQYFIDNANSGLDLKEHKNYKSISDMLSSNDESNRELGKELLLHSKYDLNDIECRYHLWLLANENYHYITSGISKNVTAFIDNSNFRSFHYMNKTKFLNETLKEGILNKKIFLKLFNDIQNEYTEFPDFRDNEFYELTHSSINGFAFRLKKEWKNLLNNYESNKSKISEPTESI